MHLQRNAYHNYILNNNFKFYISKFFRTLEFLSGFIRFAKIFSFIKENTLKAGRRQILCSFLITKKNQKITSFCQKEAKTTPFRIRNSLVKTMSLRVKRSNLNLIKFDFYNLISLINKFYTKWIASLISFVRNDNFNYAFSCALKNKFEIISQSDYGFCYKNYFFNLNQVFRNSYDFGERFGRNLNYGFGKDYNCNFKNNCDYDFEKNCSGGFGKIISEIVILVLILEMKFMALEIIWRAFYLIEKLKK